MKLLLRSASAERLGERLTEAAEHALAFRRLDLLESISSVLAAMPGKPLGEAALFYRQIAAQSNPNGIDEREGLIVELLGRGRSPYRARAMVSLAAVYSARQNYSARAEMLGEAAKAARCDGSLLAGVDAARGMAIGVARMGDHRAALKMLEEGLPLALRLRALGGVYPRSMWMVYKNALCVELAECGRVEEALAAFASVTSSPFYSVNPEWWGTAADLGRLSYRAASVFVPITFEAGSSNVVHLLPRSKGRASRREGRPDVEGDVLRFPREEAGVPNRRPKDGGDRRAPNSHLAGATASLAKKKALAARVLVDADAGDGKLLDELLEAMHPDKFQRVMDFLLSDSLREETLDRVISVLSSRSRPRPAGR